MICKSLTYLPCLELLRKLIYTWAFRHMLTMEISTAMEIICDLIYRMGLQPNLIL